MKKISRRDFLRGAAAGAVSIAASGALSAVSFADDAAPVEEQVTVQGHGDGKYTTKARGHEDYVYVVTELWDGAIKSCQVVSHKETIGIGNWACAQIPAAIVANQSINVPNLRGCSMTSRAIKAAVKEALELAGYDVEKFNTPVADPVPEVMEETIDTDVVVVGAGTAGLVAAAKLLDQGYTVTVVEKKGIPGGSMPMTYSGIAAINTPTLNNYNVDGSVPAYWTSLDGYMAIMANYLNTAACKDREDIYNATFPFERAAYTALGEAAEWMKSIGVGFMSLGSFPGEVQYGQNYYLAPGCYMGGAGYAAMFLADYITRHPNGQIKYMTKFDGFLQDAPGAEVKGITAHGLNSDDSENGYTLTVNAKATLMATGGFARNTEMLAQYEPTYKDYFFNCCSSSTGEGIQAAVAAGSKVECDGSTRHPAYLSSANSMFELAFIYASTPGILVNKKGDTCCNVTKSFHQTMAAALLDANNEGEFWYVFDENAVPSTKNFLTYGFNTYEAMFNCDEVKKFATVEEAAEALNLPGLAASIEANNNSYLTGEADAFGRNCPYMDIANGVYLLKVVPTFYLTASGICVDPEGHVLTDTYRMEGDTVASGEKISGLFGAGDFCGSIEVKDSKQYGMGFDMAVGFGYAVANTIAGELA